ncbi:MAG: hypothetical protein MJA27_36385 [Pseudanabaenales cyanobacterium]|nr:hypothetical protein [Pseudanabaenales cyanobacterium]
MGFGWCWRRREHSHFSSKCQRRAKKCRVEHTSASLSSTRDNGCVWCAVRSRICWLSLQKSGHKAESFFKKWQARFLEQTEIVQIFPTATGLLEY